MLKARLCSMSRKIFSSAVLGIFAFCLGTTKIDARLMSVRIEEDHDMLQSTVNSELKELASKIAKEPENLHELYARLQAVWKRANSSANLESGVAL
jgi:peptidoglycan hydrolase CwlO-like protein